MSATGLGVTFWNGPLPWNSAPAVMYKPDRNYHIVSIYLFNMATSAQYVELGITTGASLAAGDGSKFLAMNMATQQEHFVAVRIPLLGELNKALMGTAGAALGDQYVWCSITGEVVG